MLSITNINPRHIIHVSYGGKNEDGATLSKIHLIDGSTQTVIGDFHRNSEALAPIIPAFPGFEYLYAIENEVGEYVEVVREPIIGWRCIGYSAPLPITASGDESLANPGAILNPKGRITVQHSEDYSNVEDWLKNLNERRLCD
ncbi:MULTISPECIES: hypothetical protein [Bradyrhizobium]|uniref:hypothetical protein n=1 Tax=Bradyrhizobium TaxID=374 RepID=UPI00114126DB|nr:MULTISPECIES: hypothetical protein [Bradyrhizobium]MCA6105023.1 hypothetical protein [Bradyrhizobium australafricanum]